jgi:predicted extracellular nuclease
MKRHPTLLFAAALLALSASAAWANHDLLISEYVEGSSFNKAVEIYNPTGAAVDMSAGGYQIRHYFNGAVTATNIINLTGVIAPGDVWVLVNTQAGPVLLALADQTNANLNFNGDDVVELVKGSGTTVLDDFGHAFDPSIEWDGFAVDTFDGLGSHTSTCQPTPTSSTTWGKVKTLYR